MYRATLDTNVFVSGASLTATPPSQILNLWRKGEFVLVTSLQIISEIHEVMLRPSVMKYTKLSIREVYEFIWDIEKRAYVTEGMYEVNKITTDPDDNEILACALEGQATHIVTGDTKSLLPLKQYQNIDIVTPAQFHDLLKR